MYEIFADLHIHIGRSENNKPIKITAARSLNFANIAKECAERKGINIAGIIDSASPYVIEDIENFLKTGEAYEIKDGGIIYKDKSMYNFRKRNRNIRERFKWSLRKCTQFMLFSSFRRYKRLFKRNEYTY